MLGEPERHVFVAENGNDAGQRADEHGAPGLDHHVGHGADSHAARQRRILHVDHVEFVLVVYERGDGEGRASACG